jgi:beta-N-acetylhexosaminidase
MQLKEKVGSLFVVGFDGTTPPDSLIELIQEYSIGGVILFKRNITSKDQLARLISDIRAAAGERRMIISVDHEGGRVFRMPPPFTQFVPMGKVTSPRDAHEIGKIMATELKEVGFNVNFAPVLDANTNIKNPVIGDRSFSSDPYKVAELGSALIKGLQENGIIACGKHYPGHGDTSLDSHLALPKVSATMGRLESVELIPFAAAIESGVKSLMTAHVIYEGIDSELPATLSPKLINDLLRHKLRYKGVVFTDDLRMSAISDQWGVNNACLMSLNAGCDVCLICRDNAVQKDAINHLVEAVNRGKIDESTLDSARWRISKMFE